MSKINKICPNCSKQFDVNYNRRSQIYCSPKCRHEGNYAKQKQNANNQYMKRPTASAWAVDEHGNMTRRIQG